MAGRRVRHYPDLIAIYPAKNFFHICSLQTMVLLSCKHKDDTTMTMKEEVNGWKADLACKLRGG